MGSSLILMFAWLAIGVFGLISGSDTEFIIGLVGSTVHAAAINVMQFIKKESK